MAFPFFLLLTGAKGLGIKSLLVKVGIISKTAIAPTTIIALASSIAAIGIGSAIWCSVRPKAIGAVNNQIKKVCKELKIPSFQLSEKVVIQGEIILNSALESDSLKGFAARTGVGEGEGVLVDYLVEEHNWNKNLAAGVVAVITYCAYLAEEEIRKRKSQPA